MKTVFFLLVVFLNLFSSGWIVSLFPETVQENNFPVFSSDQKIIVFVAHQDDEAIGAATIMSRAVENNEEITVVVTTDGAPKEFGQGNFETEIRNNETKRAMSLIGIAEDDIIFLDYDDLGFVFEIDKEEEINRISELIKEKEPTQIYIQAYEGGHIDHDSTHYLVREAVKRSGLNPEMYEFPEYNAFRWGGAIPEENDTIDNEKYPVISLDLTEEEARLKKDVLKQYKSQHVFEKNLAKTKSLEKTIPAAGVPGYEPFKAFIPGNLRISFLEIFADEELLTPEKIKNPDKEHYLKISSVDYRSVWNPVTREEISFSIEDTTYLTEYGKFLAGRENLSFREKTDFVIDNYDFYVPTYKDNVIYCEGDERSDYAEILYPEKLPQCKGYLCQLERLTEEGDAEAIERYSKQITEDYERCLEVMGTYQRLVRDSYGGAIPEKLDKFYKAGSYYKYVNASDPVYGGSIECSPECRMDIKIGVGNYYSNEILRNVTLEVRQNTRSRGYIYYTEVLGDMNPRSFIFDDIVYWLSSYTWWWNVPDEPLELALILRATDDQGNNYEDVLFFTVKIVSKEKDLKFVVARKDVGGIHVLIDNYGPYPIDYYVALEVDDLGIRIETPVEEINKSARPKIDFNHSLYEPGTYESFLKLYAVGLDGETLVDAMGFNLTVEEEGFSFTVMNVSEGLLPAYAGKPHPDMANAREISFALSGIVNAYETTMKNCEEDDYLVCLFFWPDMIRKMPDYNYTKPPHNVPPRLLYETPNEKFNISLKFENFIEAIS